MGYQALLFCPDEKTARSVTQVLGELEFNVEPCSETFAAVKKLMGQHFDAIVVDCDNEQNATLLFKSARNSTPNQTSLAVAVVEGQAGVAKAFRIGANLVLTKPINVEQAKGTLRVARGLLRKGESGKTASSGATAASLKPPASTPGSPAKSAAPAARPVAPPMARPSVSPDQPGLVAAASSALIAPDQQAPAGKKFETPAGPAMSEPPAMKKTLPAKSPLSAGAIPATLEEARAALQSSPTLAHGSGAASAPAPARDILEMPPLEVLPSASTPEEDDILEGSGAEHRTATEPSKNVPPPSFTLGGASALEKSGSAKKIVLGLVAAALVAGAVYSGWTYLGKHNTQPVSSPTTASNPNSIQPAPLPSSQPTAPPAPAVAAPVTSTPAGAASDKPASEKPSAGSDKTASDEDTANPSPSPKKPTNSAPSAASKAAPAEEPVAAPLVVKGGSVPAQPAAPAADAPAPSVMGIATPGSSGPLPDLGGSDAPKPVLQRLNVSQGVSQGLLIKKVAPVYPATALRLRIEGSVQLLATITADGNISDIKVLGGDQQLTKAATDAVKQWKYKPYLLNGEPVEIQTQITINFNLPH